MKKIAIITNIPAPYRVDLFYYMQTNIREYEWHIIYTNKSESNREWSLENNKLGNSIILNSKVIEIKGKMDNRYIHIPINIGHILKKIKPDVVIAFEYNPAALQSLVWCKFHKIPFIHLTDGTLHSERNIGKIQKLSRKIIISNSSAYIASSSKAKEKLISYGVDKSKINISFLTVDNSIFNRVVRKPKKGRILYVGSLAKRKGLDLLLIALKKVTADFDLHIVGDGTKEKKIELQRLIEYDGFEDNVQFCGFKEGNELVNEYMEASIFVLPTREDCYGLVLLEALFSRVPIISSKYADGAYDIIENKINGIIEDPYDSQKFAEAIDEVIERKRYSDNALKYDISKFFFENVSKGYLDAIKYVLK